MGLDEKGVLASERGVEPRFMSILGYVGNAQLGPLHLGMFGTVALFLGSTWFFLVGIGMLQSVELEASASEIPDAPLDLVKSSVE